MERTLQEAGDLVEGLRYLDDADLINDDIAGCAGRADDPVLISLDDMKF